MFSIVGRFATAIHSNGFYVNRTHGDIDHLQSLIRLLARLEVLRENKYVLGRMSVDYNYFLNSYSKDHFISAKMIVVPVLKDKGVYED